jgi:superfamily II DNA or RNA helicase
MWTYGRTMILNGYYQGERAFTFFVDSHHPSWRSPQRGAIGELFSHWSLPRQPPALISLPTGAGKTAVALAAPHLIGARRTLVVVPGRDLRRQIATEFRSQAVLRNIGALAGDGDPRVAELSGLVGDWSIVRNADVVVALPNSISPSFYSDSAAPPQDLFDLIVVDEAHHTPAPTWRAILDHFEYDRAILLTATPRRRVSDGLCRRSTVS